jgi:hypothetical protein
MAEVIDYDKVTTLLLRHGEWYEVDPGHSRRFKRRVSLPVIPGPMPLRGRAVAPISPAPAMRLSSSVIHLEENSRGLHLPYERSIVFICLPPSSCPLPIP